MRSMQNAKPNTSARATSDINPAEPSMNLRFSCLCKPPSCTSSSAGSPKSASTNAIAESAVSVSTARLSAAMAGIAVHTQATIASSMMIFLITHYY